MTTELNIIAIFCLVDDRMPMIQKHPQAELYPSELVTIGIFVCSERRPLSSVLSLVEARL